MKRIFQEKVHSRWLILFIDQFILSWALCMSLLLIHRIDFIALLDLSHLAYIVLFHFIAIPVFILMEIHTGIIRYSNTKDMVRIFLAVLLSSMLFTGISNLFIVPYLQLELAWLDTVLLLNFFISSSLLILLRIVVKGLFAYFKDLESGEQKEKILIYGSDATAILLKQALEALQENCCQVMGFIDDDSDKVNKYIEQTKVYHSSSIEALTRKHGIEKLVVGSDLLRLDSKKRTIEKSVELGIKVLTVPPSSQWLYGKLHFSQLKDLRIEDLLQREPILLQRQNIFREVLGKRILVTGAAGSIGSEIVRQLLNYQPEYVILCDQAETPLHQLQLEVEDLSLDHKVKIYMASIQNPERMQLLFETYKPQIVFHAAACKHVPMMEDNPAEAILTNVAGTKNLADISIAFGVEKFVMISTDKAVKPTNIMGASKRLAEIYIQSLNEKQCSPRFITTRFGNVMGSNGSVIPRFKTQIERGGPVTVTHPDITRYFMTISESVQLVLEAAAMGNGGEIFIFDMGKPIKIADLALKMIKLAGLSPIRDIKIVYSGLRPGEKLHEELLHQKEQTIPTHHQKIKISRTISYSSPYVKAVIDEVLKLNQLNDNYATVKKMKEIIPEFRSNNSIYEDLDHLLFE
ncbi:NDP-sugar epimerase, includes UDP-GlcNAc-inverting 4,6-dehydratase FlaA1 and capsular polysaccharide biosynthesis protein EpsC [Pedobacter steynii]|uniref:NDP-sugar epimerase, includes UDP-GlcNAc-inverting 4,6-dehydratase FlaA1 and capsular polysaccharide biosynthesis protein EpsC n=1 Tax=Pedobacter steynii TaxID=430522 RepID=A0A1H0JBX3_9SPHI|nr:nucleoside-diphosphate sugar epimerase/dehydratase [Pedobacter steynii]NQX43094.1 polysaccharide biosynthesis protein [Pedobacter steynii]SDO41237.1 NDP-sugar epimerase, includes UDP-GlcNAc-inverting 4,6-dehydratase FlaA1 and capsular polysaccharide biosynthesis protein EpsC [Pedobacter steynii]